MTDRIEGVNPTRMELLQLKRKSTLAIKGHKLLKEKRDALIMEFFNILEEAKGARQSAESQLADAYKALIMAQATLGTNNVASASLSVKDVSDMETHSRSIMGVRVPVLNMGETKRSLLERGYGLTDTSSQLDEAATQFENALDSVIKLVEVERTIRLLAEEIEGTKRRVNALENIVIPRLTVTVKYITMRLDEMERENFFKLKRIKAVMESSEGA